MQAQADLRAKEEERAEAQANLTAMTGLRDGLAGELDEEREQRRGVEDQVNYLSRRIKREAGDTLRSNEEKRYNHFIQQYLLSQLSGYPEDVTDTNLPCLDLLLQQEMGTHSKKNVIDLSKSSIQLEQESHVYGVSHQVS